MTGLLSAEWLKLHSTRATRIAAAVIATAIAGCAALAWYVAAMYDRLSPEDKTHLSVSPLEELTLSVNQICFAVLGVLAVTAEYRTGLVRTTFTVAPRRRAVLAAKAAVLGGAGMATGIAVSLATHGICAAIIGDRPIRFYDTPADIPLLLAAGPSVLVFALLGLGLGVALRSSAGAIATVVLLWYALPIVALNLPEPWNDRVGALALTRLDSQLAGVDLAAKYGGTMPEALLSPWGAAAVLAAYAALALAPAFRWIRRDTG